jgi:hypothetical protein
VSFLPESERLHARVRAFARGALAGTGTETFDDLAADIARFQAAHIPGFRRLADAHGAALADAASIPAVPVDAFRLARVAVHPPELDVARFTTSGTTGAAPGMHAMRTTETYRELSLSWGIPALTRGRAGRFVVVALAPDPGNRITSSLAFMMRALMETLDGRSLGDASVERFEDDVHERWLAGPTGADVSGLERAARVATARGEPLLVLSTSFALALLCDVRQEPFSVPDGSVVMTTGGFKGKTREIAPDVLARRAASLFAIPASHVVGEYGMTELTSQLYERGAERRAPSSPGVFFPPPWLRVTPVHPETLEAVPAGEDGLARFVDLGNVDSAVAVVTQDVVRAAGDGVFLLGRKPGAVARGCSLAIEEMVLGARPP